MADNQTSLTARQKITAGIFLLVVIFLIWQGIGMMKGKTANFSPAGNTAKMSANSPVNSMRTQPRPDAAQLPKSQVVTDAPVDAEAVKLQQETQTKYISAVDALQLLKVAKEIAETNQAIMTAKLATAKAEKGINDLANPTAGLLINPYAKQAAGRGQPGQETPPPPPSTNYSVVSVSLLQYQWSAVISYGGNLYTVKIGDILPADGSKVASIDRSGVTLEKDGEKKKISLMPII